MDSTLSPYFKKLLEKKRSLLDEICNKNNIHSILDFGAGNGISFSKYIFQRYPNIRLTIFDESIESLNQINWSDQRVMITSNWDDIKKNKYDLIIASEVLEHQENPVLIMSQIKEYLSDSGILLITIPNGYGFNELCSFLKKLLMSNKSMQKSTDAFTLAYSPHLSFFSIKDFQCVISNSGYSILKMGNIVFSHVKPIRYLCSKFKTILMLNFFLSKILPSWLCDDWYFVLTAGEKMPINSYKKNWLSLYRAKLNNSN